MRIPLAAPCSRRLQLLSGLAADGRAELYKFVDFLAGT
ncbi:hypothetical protein IW245_000372 [Longispora fulva]|uniref:Uncharacterized protein n=1 Tax=Longispora fulva TaxID=619741 RepID=A0A8J7G5R8_9ACTN|nr:hypothetical protein [Longispora fulva]